MSGSVEIAPKMDSNSGENSLLQDTIDLTKFEGIAKKKRTRKSQTESQSANNNDTGLCNLTSADYTYEELASRFYQQHSKNKHSDPEKKFKLAALLIESRGPKSKLWKNFLLICQFLHRKSSHVSAFILSELSTTGSMVGENSDQLIIHSNVAIDRIEKVLKRYINEYVLCKSCKSPDTMLQKRGRQGFLICSSCHICSPVTLDRNYKLR